MGSKYNFSPSPRKIFDGGERHVDPIIFSNGPVVDADVKINPDEDPLALIARILEIWQSLQIQSDCIKIMGLIMLMTQNPSSCITYSLHS